MSDSAFHSLLNAKSVTIVGASEKPGSFGGQVVRNLVDFGYPGTISCVHPFHDTVYKLPCYRALHEIPDRPDCVVLAISNHRLMPALEESVELGIPTAVVFGDPHIGHDRDPHLEARITALARKSEMVICGANAMGFLSLHHKLIISGYPVRPDMPAGNIALITHSGTVFDAMTQNNRDVCFNYAISSGNETVNSVSDYLQFVVNDPTTQVVACYLETVRDPRGFVKSLQLAAERQIPVVVLKVGLSRHGQKMTQAHTGALAGRAETYSALFRRYGVCQVNSLDEMMDTIELFSRIQRVSGPDMAVLMESGGESSLLADHAETLELSFARLSSQTRERILSVLEPGVKPDNPLDAFGTGYDVVKIYRESLLALHDNTHTDFLLFAVDLVPDSSLTPEYITAVLSVLDRLDKPFISLVNLTSGASETFVAQLRRHGVPVLMGTETGLRAIRHLIVFNDFSGRSPAVPVYRGRPLPEIVAQLRVQLQNAPGPLDEYTSKKILAAYGLSIVPEQIVDTVETAVEAAAGIGYPVVLKTAAQGVLHKSDMNGVHLNLQHENAVRKAYKDLVRRFGPEILLQKMVSDGVEMILGMNADPQFGPVIVAGLGGVFVEIFKDVVPLLPPLSKIEAEELPESFQGRELLNGIRGHTASDRKALTDALLRFSTFVTDLGDLMAEVDINPLVLLPSGAVVVDALIVPVQTPFTGE